MEVRAVLGVTTAGVLAGELAAPALSAPLLFVLAGALAALWLVGRRRRRPAAWLALALAAVALGAHRMSAVLAPTFPPEHVARLTLPLPTTLEGRVAAAPERRDRRTVLLVEAEALGRGTARRQASGLVRVGVRGRALDEVGRDVRRRRCRKTEHLDLREASRRPLCLVDREPD